LPLDPSIFMQGAALKQRNADAFGNTLNGVVDAFKKDKQGLDLTKLAEAAAYKFSMGIEPTAEEIAAVRAKGMLDGSKTEYKPDEKGNIRAVTNPSPYESLYGMLNKGGVPAGSTGFVPPNAAIADESVLAGMSNAKGPMPAPMAPMGVDLDRIMQARQANAAAVGQPAMDIEALMQASGDTRDPMGNTLPAPPNQGGLNLSPLQPREIAGNPNATQVGVETAVKGDIDLQKRRMEGQIKREEAKFEPMNESQGKVATFADRIAEAEEVFGQKPVEKAQKSLYNRTASKTPLVGNALVSDEYQMGDQAERNFINSVLRRESGAVISPEEFANAREQYIPQPFDSAEKIKLKAKNRKTVLEGFKREAGPAYAPKSANGATEYQTTPSGNKYRVVK